MFGRCFRVPLERTGLYRLALEPGGGRVVAAALLAADESDLTPRGLQASRQQQAIAVDAGGPPRSVPGRQPLWPLATCVALGLLLVEWTVQHRRRE